MKKIIFKSKNLYWMLSAVIVLGFPSCKKLEPNVVGSNGAPTITSVHTVSKSLIDSTLKSTVTTYNSAGVATTTSNPNYAAQVKAFDSLTTVGKGGSLYEIVGTHLGSVISISFNGVAANFNIALGSDNNIFVSIPNTAPFTPNQSATLTVTTAYGTVNYKFTIQQPAPTILSFAPVAASAGDTITITGVVLDAATSVLFGTVPAKIVSNTTSQIKVLLPAGIIQSFITVTTAGGTVISTNSFGYKYLIYADALTTGWGGNGGGYSGYNSTINFANTSFPERGTNSIACIYTNNYGALQIGYGGSAAPSISALGLKSIKFFVYGGAGVKTGDQLQVVINGNYNGIYVTLTAGAYSSFTVPLSAVVKTGQDAITEIVLQATNVAVPSTIYVDDLGFI